MLGRQRLFLLILLAGWAHPALCDEIDRTFSRLYNFDFPGAHRLLDTYISSHPDNPMGYSVRSSVYLFDELNRLGILEAEFFADDKRITDKKKLKPDAVIRTRFFDAVEAAQSRALSTLASQPEDY